MGTAAAGPCPSQSADAHLYAVSASDGRQRWRRKTQGPVSSTPAVANGVVYFASYDGKLYALDAVTGAQRWFFTSEGERRFEAKGLHGLLPRHQTIADRFDVFPLEPRRRRRDGVFRQR